MWLLKLIAFWGARQADKKAAKGLTYEAGQEWRHQILEPELVKLSDWMARTKWLKRFKSPKALCEFFAGALKSNALNDAAIQRAEHRQNEGC